MSKIKVLIVLAFLIILVLFTSGVVPKQIAKRSAILYVNREYKSYELEYVEVFYSPVHGAYFVSFASGEETFNFMLNGKLLPIDISFDPLKPKM